MVVSSISKRIKLNARYASLAILTVAILLTALIALRIVRELDIIDSFGQVRAEDVSNSDSNALAEWRVFLVAANAYDVGVNPLRYAESDAQDLRQIFRALGVKDENITVLTTQNDKFSLRPYKESIDDGYKKFLAGLNENSIAFVFLSGHGFCLDENGETRSYYAPADFREEKRDEKKVSIDDMIAQLAKSPAHFKWMCVDACRNPLRRGGEKSLSIADAPKGVVLMQSCKMGQFSYEVGKEEGAPFNNGLFTRAFIDAVSARSQDADADRDGSVSLGELCDYVTKRVPQDAKKYCNANQDPIFTPFDVASLDDFAKYTLFEDRNWREALRLWKEAEKFVEQKSYQNALDKISEANRLRPQDDEIAKRKEEIEKLWRATDDVAKAQELYNKAEAARQKADFRLALDYVDEALKLDPDNTAYKLCKELIEKASYSEENRRPGDSMTTEISGVKVKFRWCPPGSFSMGSPEGEQYADADKREIQHKVKFTRGFWLCEVPVTVAAFRKFVQATGYRTEAEKANEDNTWNRQVGLYLNALRQDESHPVVFVSWNDAQEYIRWLNSNYAPQGCAFKLPSESHWEYACRAGTKTLFWWGDNLEDGNDKMNVPDKALESVVKPLANQYPEVMKMTRNWMYFSFNDGRAYTSPVGSYRANPWGFKDMLGNVNEWCEDWYGDYPVRSATDPVGASTGTRRVMRGGSWLDNFGDSIVSHRVAIEPNRCGSIGGFRLELTASISEQQDLSLPPGEFKEVTIAGQKTLFRWCPPGEFIMGTPSPNARIENETQHRVTFTRGFWMAETETTQELWQAVMGDNPSFHKGDDQLPVEQVSWLDCREFVKRIQSFAPEGMKFKLPSEAQWEYACRAGTKTAYAFGDNLDQEQANFEGDGTKSVGCYDGNNWGLKDMHGNVWEWCEDWYGEYPSDAVSDPLGAKKGVGRVVRGGGWRMDASGCRSAFRDASPPDYAYISFGFRLELVAESEESLAESLEDENANLRAMHAESAQKRQAGETKSVNIAGTETVFHWCPPGEFMMGKPGSTPDQNISNSCHKVTLTRGFWICEIPVTTRAYREFVKATGYKTDSEKKNRPYNWDNPNLERAGISWKHGDLIPVTCVSWNDAQAYVKWLNDNYAPEGSLFSLPTEAHWEYACRAGTDTTYWWGDKPEDGAGNLNCADKSLETLAKNVPKFENAIWNGKKTEYSSFDDGYPIASPVGKFNANPWGLKDMLGNVSEWCEDIFELSYPTHPVTDPVGGVVGSARVARGGGWAHCLEISQSASRFFAEPDVAFNTYGFRIELSEASQ